MCYYEVNSTNFSLAKPYLPHAMSTSYVNKHIFNQITHINVHFIDIARRADVTIVLDTPYVMLREDNQTNLTGNDRYEGYIVDLIDAVSKILSNNECL